MAFTGNQSEQNRHLQSRPFYRHHTNGNTPSKIDQQVIYDSELDLTHDESLSSIFVTDSSKILTINEQNIAQQQSKTSMNTG
jgi:hypothetical protein